MPKKRLKRKPANASYVAQSENSNSTLKQRIIKWASISVILAILMSLMIAAISVSPSSAATPTPTVCEQIDTDGDAITNDVDSDIDGDGTVNGLDDDIDGDSVVNTEDSDPAATNCGFNAPPPTLRPVAENDAQDPSVWVASITIALLGVGYILLRRIRRKQK